MALAVRRFRTDLRIRNGESWRRAHLGSGSFSLRAYAAQVSLRWQGIPCRFAEGNAAIHKTRSKSETTKSQDVDQLDSVVRVVKCSTCSFKNREQNADFCRVWAHCSNCIRTRTLNRRLMCYFRSKKTSLRYTLSQTKKLLWPTT